MVKLLLSLKLLVVLSASMGSALPVGSLAMARPQSEYFVGDVVTFKIPNSGELLTHRVESVKVSRCRCVTEGNADGVRIYKTRGDANNVSDEWELTDADIVGKIIFHLPYLGYLLRLPQTIFAWVF
jgi:signal peptidase